MNPYFEQMILGASPVELVRLLFQRAVVCTREARSHLAAGNIAERSRAISNAYAVLVELMSSLKPHEAPELAARLRSLYCYMQGRLTEANLTQTDAPLAEVLGLLTTLSEGWKAAPAPAKSQEWIPAAGTESQRIALTA